MYYKLVKGRLYPAPENIKKLIGNPTAEQYLFFGYKPLCELMASGTGDYINGSSVEKSDK